jgi:hypothetical protein
VLVRLDRCITEIPRINTETFIAHALVVVGVPIFKENPQRFEDRNESVDNIGLKALDLARYARAPPD